MDTSPKTSGSRRYPKHPRSVNTIHLKLFLCLLATRPHSRQELVEITGLMPGTVLRYIQILHQGPDNLIYVSEEHMSEHGRLRQRFSLGFRVPDIESAEPNRRQAYNRRLLPIEPVANIKRSSIVKTSTGVKHVLR